MKALAAVLILLGAHWTVQGAAAQTHSQAPGGWSASVSKSPPAPPPVRKHVAPKAVPSPGVTGAVISHIGVAGDRKQTRLQIRISKKTEFTAFSVGNPYRIVVDMEAAAFDPKLTKAQASAGLARDFRFGLFAENKARIVVDTDGPTRVVDAVFVPPRSENEPGHLVIRIEETTAAVVAAADLATAATSIEIRPAPESKTAKPEGRKRPVIIVDPGHGGIDPGAEGRIGPEKTVVLAVGKHVHRALSALDRYEVVMTRSTDVFIPLGERVRISRKHHAELFVSIHADSLEQKNFAQKVRGATIYTLSERASDERSRALADKENASDLLAGLPISAAGGDVQVRDILLDLVLRETSTLSADFRERLLTRLKPRMKLSRDPTKEAPFKVLRQPGSPSVLIELGYMSNTEDEKLMAQTAWQRGVGEAIARAIDDYFRHHKRPGR